MKKGAPNGAPTLRSNTEVNDCIEPTLSGEHQDEIIEFYRECVAGEMLASICTTDAIFDCLCHELAGHHGIREKHGLNVYGF